MPSRDGNGNAGRQAPGNRSTGATARQRPSARASQEPTEDDMWDEVENMGKGGQGDDGQFNKMNTNFYLKDGEEIDIVLLDNAPTVFSGHVIKCKSDAGHTFYRTEACQKSEQDSCVLCESDNKAVSKAKKVIAFRVLDSRGSWDKSLNNGKGGLDGVPVPKIFLVPVYLAKQFKTLRDDAGGELTDKVIKLAKNSTYSANFRFGKNRDGSLFYIEAPEYDGDFPEILEVYAPGTDDDVIDFVRKFADGGGNAAPADNNRSGGNANRGASRPGSFGNY